MGTNYPIRVHHRVTHLQSFGMCRIWHKLHANEKISLERMVMSRLSSYCWLEKGLHGQS
ncbi:hypothetical protein HanIR_Chr05g0221301 [Helianthus annuus]|nr:hypothetical protein HanIR_Chr05g0221301 [Helianthus annuus]